MFTYDIFLCIENDIDIFIKLAGNAVFNTGSIYLLPHTPGYGEWL